MPVRFRIRIDAKPEEVYAYLAEVSRHGEWGNPKAGLAVEAVSQGPVVAGSLFRSTQKFLGKDTGAEIKVTDVSPPARFAFSARHPGGKRDITYSHAFTITPANGGSLVERAIDSDAPPMQKVVGLFAYPAIRADAMAGLRRLKERLEHP